ncbi:MAG: energy-coupling factor transporter transmembrane protein EcfT [Haloarculaceae archaeon]
MLRYRPGSTIAHALDPRAKLAFQFGFAVTAFAHTTLGGLAGLTALTAGVLVAARLSPLRAAVEFRVVLPILVAGPLLEGLTLGSPWFSVQQAWFPALASYRALLILFVSTAYVYTTPVRESRAAIQWAVPGRVGRVLATGVAFVFRFLPVLQADLRRTREAMAARLGTERPLSERMRLVATAGLRRTTDRADALSLALQARCYSWNPTPPPLSFGLADGFVVLAAVALLVSAVVP